MRHPRPPRTPFADVASLRLRIVQQLARLLHAGLDRFRIGRIVAVVAPAASPELEEEPGDRSGEDDAGTGPNAGKLSEPVLRLGRLLRAFATPPSDNPPVLGRYLMWNADEELGQWPMQSPTVFNFFHTDFKPTGPLMDAGLNAPEFEITTELTTVDTSNYFFEGTYNGFYTNAGPRAVMNYTSLTSLWSTPDLLLARIENLLLGRPLSAPLRASLLNLHTLHSASPTQGVRVMMQVLTSSPEFSVDR